MARPQLRYAHDSDAAAILDFWSHAAHDQDRPADTLEAVRALIARDSAALILATSQDRLVGTVIAGWDGWRAHVYRLAVAPEHRRSGVGTLLLKAAELRFSQFGAGRVDAVVLDTNTEAHSVWSSRGYERQTGWSRWVRSLRGGCA